MFLTVGSTVKDDRNNIYKLDEMIGQGGFGAVFRAHKENTKSVFAIKTMLHSFSDSAAKEAFENEIHIAAGINGKNIINYEFVHDGDKFPELPPYIIMEYATGGTLRLAMDQKRQAEEMTDSSELIEIFKQLASGIDEINRSLVHRDIKPANILLCGNTLKISDFGLSKLVAENTRTMTFKGSGTPRYMAPEAWDYSKNTIQMDIYSMGIVFYELATLKYPYEPIPRTYEDCKNAHIYSAIVDLEKINPSLPANLISVINRMLEKSTKRRFSNWQDIIQLLNDQPEIDSPIAKMVDMAVSSRNAEDIARHEMESKKRQSTKQKSDSCKLVRSYFKNAIIDQIVNFTDQINAQYAGDEKITLHDKVSPLSRQKFYFPS
jgi:serine/threonine protein kinase